MKLAHIFAIFMTTVIHSIASGPIQYPEEIHLRNIRQLTFSGTNAEAYFSFDNRKIVFQAANFGSKCDQIYQMDLENPSNIRRISTGLGVCTCSYFLPDNSRILFASTFRANLNCPPKLCKTHLAKTNETISRLCNTTYTWDIYQDYDIYLANKYGNILRDLVSHPGYDAEATVSPNSDRIVFTSIRSGDLELWTINLNGTGLTQITNETGYDGGAFFSPDGQKLVFRASRPKTEEAIAKYKELLKFNLVSPTEMEIFVVDSDGGNLNQITQLGGANWAPFYHPDNRRIIFSSNHKSSAFNFNLFLINENGTGLERVTYDPVFDAFPMFSFDGKQLIFASSRNASKKGDINLFIADWLEKSSSNQIFGKVIMVSVCIALVFY